MTEPFDQLPQFVAKTIAQVAGVLGVSTRTVREYLSAGCPGRRNDYKLGEIVRWARENVWTARINETSPDGNRLRAAELLKAESAAAMSELRRRKLAGELVEKSSIVAMMVAMSAVVRSRLQAMPGELATSFPPEIRADLMSDVDNKISLILTDLANTPLPDDFQRILAAVQKVMKSNRTRPGKTSRRTTGRDGKRKTEVSQ